MRIRVPGRFIAASAILATCLCLLPASTKTAVAKPIGWEDVGPPDPNPKGDNDGVVLKSRYSTGGSGSAYASARNDLRGLRLYLTALKLDYWSFWLR